jgi:uncharacterized protein YlxW (UPF0749 family)
MADKPSALGDLRALFANRSRYHWWGVGISILLTVAVVSAFMVENRFNYAKPETKLIVVENWKEGRTRAEAEARQAEERKILQAKIEQYERDQAAANAKMDELRRGQ